MKHTGQMIHQIDDEKTTAGVPAPLFLGLLVGVVVLGIGAGFGLSKIKPGNVKTGGVVIKNDGKTAGVSDKKTFKDSSEGILREGGIDGEGSFHLERPGGVSQNVYLTSSTVDLSLYIGKKVRVHGETFNAQKAGWLMDVGLVELL